jgi:hypothetical protein
VSPLLAASLIQALSRGRGGITRTGFPVITNTGPRGFPVKQRQRASGVYVSRRHKNPFDGQSLHGSENISPIRPDDLRQRANGVTTAPDIDHRDSTPYSKTSPAMFFLVARPSLSGPFITIKIVGSVVAFEARRHLPTVHYFGSMMRNHRLNKQQITQIEAAAVDGKSDENLASRINENVI